MLFLAAEGISFESPLTVRKNFSETLSKFHTNIQMLALELEIYSFDKHEKTQTSNTIKIT